MSEENREIEEISENTEDAEEKKPAAPEGLLKDAPPAPQRPRPPKKTRKELEEERARREREERIELLKMKQGLIEESETIPETGYVEIRKLRGWEKFTNFMYHNKMWIIICVFFFLVVGICVYQLITRERFDFYVLAVSAEPRSELGWRQRDIKDALEMYCPDYDGNGKVNVCVTYIDRSDIETVSEYTSAQSQKFIMEMTSGQSQLIISEEGFWEQMYADENGRDGEGIFVSMEDKCSEDMLFHGRGVRINRTGFDDSMRWRNCPDNICLYLRDARDIGVTNMKKVAEDHRRAEEVLQNILDGNIINPPESASGSGS